MNENDFTDYYELLQVSSNADADTVERVFRHLAKKFHPDNKESGDVDRFHLLIEAHQILSDPENRASYDVKYQDYWNSKWKITSEASSKTAFGDDWENRESVLSLLYVQRRRDMKKPGLGDYELAHLLSIPFELLEFDVWYLKAKGLVERLEAGHLAITALGVDQIEKGRLRLRNDHMLMPGGVAPEGGQGQTTRPGLTDLPEFPTNGTFNQVSL